MSDWQKGILWGGSALFLLGLVVLGLAIWDPMRRSKIEAAMVELREADAYLKQNTSESPRESLVIFTRVLARDLSPELNQLARYGLALALEKNQDFGGALEHYQTLNKEELDAVMRTRIDFSMGKMYLLMNHEAEGLSKLQLLLASSEDARLKGKIHSVLGAFYLRKGDFERARENFAVALKYDPENVQAEVGRADALKEKGESSVALDYYQEYLFGSGNLSPIQREKILEKVRRDTFDEALALLRSGKYETALEGFRKTYEANSDKGVREQALYYMGESLLSMRKHEEALKQFEAVLANPAPEMDQQAQIKIGQVFFDLGQYRKASLAFLKAEKDFPPGPFTATAREWKRESEEMSQDGGHFRVIDQAPLHGGI